MTTIAAIRAATAAHYGLTEEQLLARTQKPKIARPRMVAMYLARKMTGRVPSVVGRHMGPRDRTTVIHAEREIHARLHDPAVMADLTAICAKLGER